MPALPDGEPVGDAGPLTPAAAAAVGIAPMGLYLHVPFCRVRCGYCDFNTYTRGELGESTGPADYLAAVRAEASAAIGLLGPRRRSVSTVFVGGGTPTLLGAVPLGNLISDLRDQFGFEPDAEITVEANPDSIDAGGLRVLAAAGVTRVSFGVQSVVPRVLAALDRTHDPAAVPEVLAAAADVGLITSVDLIYGAPGESADDWRRSLDAVMGWAPDHVSAYALVVEPGTRLAGQVRRGEVDPPADDDLADRYEAADESLTGAGYRWYEVSNWARTDSGVCRHNLGYWRGHDWWGLGPGAHSHVAGVRWWNTKHPATYAERISAGRTPAVGREVLTAAQQRDEAVLLGVRLAAGCAVPVGAERSAARLQADGLIEADALAGGRVVLTRRGRLLADGVVRTLLADSS